MSELTELELKEIDRANESGRVPIVFIHGLWLLPSSWARWRTHFETLGYTSIAPGWPDDPDTVEEARQHPERFAHKSLAMIGEKLATAISKLRKKPALIGHSFGGVLTEMLAGRGLAIASVAIDPAPFRGVVPLPVSSIRAAAPVLSNPANHGKAVLLTFEQFKYGWANNLSDDEAKQLYEEFHVPGSGAPLFSAAFANVNPWTDDKVDTRNPARGPLLIISGEKDHTVPWAVASAAYERQKVNPSPTEIIAVPERGHSLTIDHGWREVADLAAQFLAIHARP